MRRLAAHLVLCATVLLLVAPVALAGVPDHGKGTYGEVNDKVTTNAGFILLGFFSVFCLVATLLQSHLDNRKKRRKAAAKARLSNAQWRGGW